jgi:2-polyprenyl-6-methoxyphenol hydroxylase-like FAD-dependent oxidoreductase
MPPQGESTGLAIEDGVLLAHVLSRLETRSVDQLLADYEALRRQTVDAAWKEADWRWKGAAKADAGWFSTFLMEAFMSSGFIVNRMNAKASKHFASDVDLLELPD